MTSQRPGRRRTSVVLGGRRQRWAVALAAPAVVALLAGCQHSVTSPGAAGTSTAPPVSVRVTPADGTKAVSPSTPVEVAVTGGSVQDVQVTEGDGHQVEGAAEHALALSASTASASASSSGSTAAAASGTSSEPDDADDGAERTVWTPADPLDYGTDYTVSVTSADAQGAETTTTSTFSTVDPDDEQTPSVGPLDGSTVGVGMPIRVYFTQAVDDDRKAAVQRQLKVTTSKRTDGVWSWLSDTEVHFRPSHYWPAHTEVTLDADLYGVELADGVWGEKDRSISFTIGDAHVSVADAATHTMTVKDDGDVVQTWPISAGSPENPSHNGTHVVTEKYAAKIMDSSTFGLAVDAPGGYRAKVRWATRISNNGEFVHAAPWSVAQQGSSNVSHGCINVSTDRAKWFYDFSQPGDVVEIQHSDGPQLSAADGDIYDWTLSWQKWQAGSALS